MQQRYKFIILFATGLLLTSVFIFLIQRGSCCHQLVESTRNIVPGASLDKIKNNLNFVLYDSREPGFDDHDWYEREFDVKLNDGEICLVFSPDLSGLNNLVIVVVSDENNKVKHFVLRET